MPQNSADPGWRISEWSRDLGRGCIRSEHLGSLDFDAACADVDDFRVGEPVNVRLERVGASYRVVRVQPSDLRLPGKLTDDVIPANLDPSIEIAMLAEISTKRACSDYRVRSFAGGVLALEGDDDCFTYGHEDEIEISGVGYVAVPVRFRCQCVRLATTVERAYVSKQVEISSSDAVITFVEDETHFHFVVGAHLQWRRRPASA